MGNNNAQILSPYYDKYFGSSYFQKIDGTYYKENIYKSCFLPQTINIEQFLLQPEKLIKSDEKILNNNHNLISNTNFK